MHNVDAPQAPAQPEKRHRHAGRVAGAFTAFGSTPALRCSSTPTDFHRHIRPNVTPPSVRLVCETCVTVSSAPRRFRSFERLRQVRDDP